MFGLYGFGLGFALTTFYARYRGVGCGREAIGRFCFGGVACVSRLCEQGLVVGRGRVNVGHFCNGFRFVGFALTRVHYAFRVDLILGRFARGGATYHFCRFTGLVC